jgi:hypothetical protein
MAWEEFSHSLGQKLPTWTDRAMSALHQLATKLGTSPVVRFVPNR